MIGDAYFQFRAQIGTSLFSLAKIARDLDAPEEALASLQELQAGLREPFHFITLGETGSGKSAFLNALFSREFAGDPASAGRTVVFRHGSETRDHAVSGEIVEAERPHIFLRDFMIADAAGLGTPASAPDLLKKYLSGADAVFFVLSVNDDPTQACEYLAQADRESLRRFVFVIQKADTVEGEALMSTVLALHDRIMQKIGNHRSMFPVSAQTRAGFEKLERYIENEIISTPARFDRLREICTSADNLLVQLGSKTIDASQVASRKLQIVEEERTAMAGRKDEALRSLDRHLWSIAQTFEATQRRGEELLRRRISLHSLWQRPDWRESFHHEVDERLHEGIDRNIQLTVEQCDREFREAWDAHRARLKECNGGEPPEFAEDGAARAANLQDVVEQFDSDGATTEVVVQQFLRLRKTIRLAVFALPITVILAGIAVAHGHYISPGVVLFILALAATILAPRVLCDSLSKTLFDRMAARRESVVMKIEERTRAEIERVFEELKLSIDALEQGSSKERSDLEPMVNRLLQLAELFDHCVDEIDARKARPAAATPAAA